MFSIIPPKRRRSPGRALRQQSRRVVQPPEATYLYDVFRRHHGETILVGSYASSHGRFAAELAAADCARAGVPVKRAGFRLAGHRHSQIEWLDVTPKARRRRRKRRRQQVREPDYATHAAGQLCRAIFGWEG